MTTTTLTTRTVEALIARLYARRENAYATRDNAAAAVLSKGITRAHRLALTHGRTIRFPEVDNFDPYAMLLAASELDLAMGR